MLKKKILPNQLLVEFDELHNNSLKGYLRATITIFKLLKNGYKLIKTERFVSYLLILKINQFNFLYFLNLSLGDNSES